LANERTPPHNPLEGDRPEIVLNLHDGSDEQVSIVVVHKDRPEYLNICLQSIATCSYNNNYELIVVDNASGKDSQDYLDDIKDDVKLIRNPNNLYFSAAANKGAQAADRGSKYIIFMHCDVVVLNPAWLDLMINVSESTGSGFVGLEQMTYYMANQRVDFIQEWCMLMTKECYKDIGPWPEELPQIGHSFIMTVKANQKGYKPQVMKTSVCHHYKAFSLDINEYERMTEKAMTTIPKLIQSVQSVPVGR
jgi:GT2 family glycosyltransferase